jgi:hypothetical protein
MSRLAGVKRKLKMRCSRAASSRPSDRRLNAEEVDRYNFCSSCPPDVSGVLPSKRPRKEQDHETPDESAGHSAHGSSGSERNGVAVKKIFLQVQRIHYEASPSRAKLSADQQDELQKALAPFEKQAMVAASTDDASASGEAAMPDIMRIWHGQRLPGAQVFVKAVWEEFVTATAAGEKFFESSNAKNMFRELDAGDLLLLVQTRSQQRVAAVAEVAHPAVSRERNRAVLYDRLPRRLHGSLNAYLDRADAFDYVQFRKVYDLRDCNLKLQHVLAHGGFCMDTRKNLGMGVLKVVETTDSSIESLRDFLDTQTARLATSLVDAVDVF